MQITRSIAKVTAIVFLSISSLVLANADTLPLPVFSVGSNNGPSLSTPGKSTGTSCNKTDPKGGCQTSSALLAYDTGSLSGFASGMTSGGSHSVQALAAFIGAYYFEVVGPSGVLVPLIATASGSTSANGKEAVAMAQVDAAGVTFEACSGSGTSRGSCPGEKSSFSGSKPFSLLSNQIADVLVTASGESGPGPGSFLATSDPMIAIDPTFADASQFTLEFSAVPGGTGGGGGTSPVPEPSTLALLGTGVLAGLGTLRRRQSAHSARF